MGRKKIIIILTLMVGIVAVTIMIFVLHSTKSAAPSPQSAQPIPPGTYFAQVRRLSAGTKPSCLARDPALDQVVQADDNEPFDTSFSAAIGTVIPDMPAGHTTTYLHMYTPTNASGYIIFSDKNQQSFAGNLKSFNFTIERGNKSAAWKLKSFIACVE
jgi:hypothetical protein